MKEKTHLTFPNCSKYCFTSSTTVLADKPPTNIFFVLVTIWKRERERGQRRRRWATGASNAPRGDFNETSNAASEPAPATRVENRQKQTHRHECGRKKRFVLTCYYCKVTSAAAYILLWFLFLAGPEKKYFVLFFHTAITNWASNQNRLSTN